MQPRLGTGKWKLAVLTDSYGVIGVGILHSDTQHKIGEFTGEEAGTQFELTSEDTVIWLENLDSARILQDTLNCAILKMQGCLD